MYAGTYMLLPLLNEAICNVGTYRVYVGVFP